MIVTISELICIVHFSFIAIVNFGYPSMECGDCGVQVWLEERALKVKRVKDVSICCQRGTVELPLLQKPPPLLYSLICGTDDRSNHFRQNIRAYNSMFAFTSIRGKVDSSWMMKVVLLSLLSVVRIFTELEVYCQKVVPPQSLHNSIFNNTENEVENRTRHFGYASLCCCWYSFFHYKIRVWILMLISQLHFHFQVYKTIWFVW